MLIMKEARPREPKKKKIRNTPKEGSLMLRSSLLLLAGSFAVLLCNHVAQVLLEPPVRWILLLSLGLVHALEALFAEAIAGLYCIQIDRHFNVPRLLALAGLVLCAENRRLAC